MNPIFHAASEATTMGWLMATMTVVFFLFFLGWAWYAYRPGNQELMNMAARMPLDDGGEA
ncbi:MAG: cbb3-type cytochrome c oxidase subunit 3 [Myxococcota bacterium]